MSIDSQDAGMMRPDPRFGSALLDVVIALALLGLSGVGLVTLVGQTVHSMEHVANEERDVRLAASELDRFVVYDRAQMVAMAGQHDLRGWSVTVGPVAPDLFDLSIARTDTSAVLLRTTVYRPDTTDAPTP
jgi:hypothetical protein